MSVSDEAIAGARTSAIAREKPRPLTRRRRSPATPRGSAARARECSRSSAYRRTFITWAFLAAFCLAACGMQRRMRLELVERREQHRQLRVNQIDIGHAEDQLSMEHHSMVQ